MKKKTDMSPLEQTLTNSLFAHYFRYLWNAPDLIVVLGEALPLWHSRHAYCQRHHIQDADTEGIRLLERLFAAAGLAAVQSTERELWGWSLSLPGLSTGLFCGVEPEGMVCGRVLASPASKNLTIVQHQSPKSPMAQSHFTLMSQDPVEAVERYFEEAEQTLIRIAVDGSGRGVLLRPLPGGRFDDIQGLSDEALIARCRSLAADGSLKKLDEVLLFYECPCTGEKLQSMLESLPEQQRGALWADSSTLAIECPRCARKHLLARRQ
jgi:molecular chaperone Hsp33